MEKDREIIEHEVKDLKGKNKVRIRRYIFRKDEHAEEIDYLGPYTFSEFQKEQAFQIEKLG